MVEFDVRRTRDDELVAFHDADVQGRPTDTLSRAEIARAIGHLPPSVAEVLDTLAGRIGLDVELKEDGYVERALRLITPYVPFGPVVITSFLDAVVLQVKRLQPAMRAGLLVGQAEVQSSLSARDLLRRLAASRADFLGLDHRIATEEILHAATAHGIEVAVWTVNEAADLARVLADDRIAAVITDVPDRALRMRDARP
jgi:glycerophosphoryl diester phosphodiesterase